MKTKNQYVKEHVCILRSCSGARRCSRVKNEEIDGKMTERIVCFFGDDSKTVSIHFPYKHGWNSDEAKQKASEYTESVGGVFHESQPAKNSSILPSAEDAINVHDVAHSTKDEMLHGIARKMLDATEQPHICVDELDGKDDENYLSDFPPTICVDSGVVSAVGAQIYGNDETCILSMDKKYADILPERINDVFVGKVNSTDVDTSVPIYDLLLVRRSDAYVNYPLNSVIVGEHVKTGCFRRSGAYRFPLYAQKIQDDYTMIQVHKTGDEVKLFDQNGNQPKGYATSIDKFIALENPHDALFMCLGIDGDLYTYDVLSFDGKECTMLPLYERIDILNGISGINVIDAIEIHKRDDLFDLECGSYVVRHQNEVVTDMIRPFWFFYESGKVKPRQPIPPHMPISVDNIPDAYITHNMPEDGVYAQIHKSRNGISVYIGDGARDRSNELPDLCEAFEDFPEDFVVECILVLKDQAGFIKSPDFIYKDTVFDCAPTAYCFDIAYYGDDVSSIPRNKREELLNKFVTFLDKDVISLYCENGTYVWGWQSDSCVAISNYKQSDSKNNFVKTKVV